MNIQSLNGKWNMSDGLTSVQAEIPGSVYSAYLAANRIDDPYYRLNQYKYRELSDKEYTFFTDFIPTEKILSAKKIILRFNGIDTLSTVHINGREVGSTDNMHRTYEFDVSDYIFIGMNSLSVTLKSPIEYISRKNAEKPLWGVSSTMNGYPHIRKAHYMFGWDWGPQLPDLGIWRSVELVGISTARIDSVYIRQKHHQNSVRLTIDATVADKIVSTLRAEVTITSPDGTKTKLNSLITDKQARIECVISSPSLWNVRGYGRPNLYAVSLSILDDETVVDSREFNIGLRTLEICREKDLYGEGFCFKVNGVKIFAMGANYVPEDNILSRRSPEKTKELLTSCAAANYNMIRVWGGGIYPDDYFYDTCDKLGILVWQDMMFACSVYDGSDVSFCTNVRYELIDNIKRIRNHPCIGMWCGNNEIESAWQYWGLPDDATLKNGYLRMFEALAPKVVSQFDPERFYWPSSPSSGGGFNDSGAQNKGDTHYWEVWHGVKPFTEYKKHLFRFCSEYGFESIPCMKTVKTFAEAGDLNLMSPVMEAHQKCENGNEKLMYYIAQMVHYPYSFTNLVYASQLVQADAIRLNVEQMRRHRGICMGSLYWQVNDSNPVISWSSIDYFGRWKALHYYAKKFYAQLLCSVDDSSRDSLVFNVSNEKDSEFTGTLRWRVRKNTTEITSSGECEITVPPLSAVNCLTLTHELTGVTPDRFTNSYIEYELIKNGAVISDSTYMYCLPKQFEFLPPDISVSVDMIGDIYRVKVSSVNFAKGVYLDFDEFDSIFSDNWFDLHGHEHIVLINKSALPPATTMRTIAPALKIKTYYDLCSAVE